MHLILVPGLWLDGRSWGLVTPLLEAAGHDVVSLTLPGMTPDEDRSLIGVQDHVDALIAAIDAQDPSDPVVLIGHSGGGAVAHAALDARPERVRRAIYVASEPISDGSCINDELPASNGEVPLPEWSFFDEEMLLDMHSELREEFRARAIPSPARVCSDPVQLRDARRHDIPITMIACEYPSTLLKMWMAQGLAGVQELSMMRHVDWIDLPTGHWPQFTKPVELADAILAALPSN
jgi:pimeloyl-ACP methyl ester carboxylesterase